MLRYSLALLAGAYALQFFASLPPDRLLVPAFALALAALVVRRARIVALLVLGFCIAWHTAKAVLDDRLPPESAGETLVLTGRVADFPEHRGGLVRFVLETAGLPDLPQRIRLSWYEAAVTPRVGETWTLHARLRRPRGFANPIGFDYEEWLFRQRIGATGYVVAHPDNRRLDQVPVAWQARRRRHIAERIVAVTGDNDASAVLQAIVVGARHRITQTQWERYAVSGTSHLMAISGLHIGLSAGGAWLLGWALIAPFCRWQNVRDAAALVALCSAAAYVSVSGFAIPAQRALLMALVVIGAGLLRRQLPAERVLAAAAVVVFLGDPLSIMAPGFRLSFAAVAILLWSARQRPIGDVPAVRGGRWAVEIVYRLPPLQLTLLLGLLPLTALTFGRIAWLAPVVNLLVLPLFNFATVPAALVGTLLDGPLAPVGDALLRASCYSIRSMLAVVALVGDWPPARLHVATSGRVVVIVALLAALWAVLPPGWPGRRLAWVAAAATVLLRPAAPPAGCVDMTALDVGQGLAMVLRTRGHVLVFDTGPAFRNGGDSGRLVLVPYLRAAGIDRVDLLMVSHADSDHAGGAASLAAAVPVARVVTGGFVDGIAGPQWRCRRGHAWLWDGVRFAVMHPARTESSGQAASDNDESCVLEIVAGEHRALLTGDIEQAAEKRLLESGSLSNVDLVVVPHHGSLTSSSEAFVRRLQPQVAFVSAGFENRWSLPREEVVERWQQNGARVFNTATLGAVRVRMCADTGLDAVEGHRVAARKYWHEPGS